MGISLEEQAYALLQAVLLGGALGLLYDVFRVIRVRVRLRLVGGALDLLFWLVVTAALFWHAVSAQGGEVRIYMVLAVFAGAVVYFLLCSRWVLKAGYLTADFLGVLWHIATLPVRGLLALCKKIRKILPLSKEVV